MAICEQHPEMREMLQLLVQAQLVQGHVFFLSDMDSDRPEPVTDVNSIVDAICGEEPLMRFSPKSHGISNDSESDTCDNG